MEWSTNPAEKLRIDGVALEYACHGPVPGDAPTLVLLHEGLGCVAMWRDFPAQLAARTGLGVLVYSRQGYGGSDPITRPRPLDFQTREALEVLPALLDAAGIRQAILLGHSDGATIAAIHTGSVAGHRIRGVILEAPHFFTEPGGLASITEARAAYESGDLKQKLARYHADPDGAFLGWNDAWLDPGFATWNVAEVIDYIRVPILAIQGRHDQYGTLAQIEEIENRAYCPVDTLILDCRHEPHRECADRVLQEIADFCARLIRIEAADVVPA
ncbi:alpha/beta hydrolase [Ruegeria pomeroyi]|uniref:Alpha/beta hydrolase n=1 Tax=Ruegeria alba TaxID=2916756 RepID=A0ABS9NXW5_9RHOB|nr:alpha/beta hydrolase [Ruegeria alba]MCE8515119.1 alpha/beta hydrolase [Ruegeria pomeroyi]MCE8524525.1 alpha/beta hydrolase [Ruegeria pomeroyi]MCE8528933.1 alpha/beta hydrolase [Ruegeria pomeroyi]MCE8556530.1 alpha/beta hydrolase [Ruegeria pomeroyi]MCG6558994.1 alpha/beta hydrolase [Ruegeria alba]